MTEYFAPAPLDEETTQQARAAAERAYAACGCRDYARVDFIFAPRGLFLLEINTLPGMKETSLLPMSARVVGLDFSALVRAMVTPALQRYRADQAVLRQ
jgi:D-alanine-D-alanine ligase